MSAKLSHEEHQVETARILQEFEARGLDLYTDVYCIASMLRDAVTDKAAHIASRVEEQREAHLGQVLRHSKNLPEA